MIDGLDDYSWAMNEPDLRELSHENRDATAIRFLYISSFNRKVSVRITKSGKTITLTAVQLDGMGGYAPGKVALKKVVRLSQEQWETVSRKLEKLKFWEMKREKWIPATAGANLELEAASLGNYHVAFRRFPVPGDYLGLFRSMIQLSGIDERVAFDAKKGVHEARIESPAGRVAVSSLMG